MSLYYFFSETRRKFKSLTRWQQILWIFNVLVYFYSFLAFLAIYVPPASFWPAGFLTLSIPIVLVVHIFLTIYWIWVGSRRAWASLVILVMGYPFFERTFNLHWSRPATELRKIKVLSFNTQRLNAHDYYEGNRTRPKQIIEWIRDSDADIKCLQEFHDEDGSSVFNAITKIATKGDYNYYITPLDQYDHRTSGFDGVAIFSKFPIIRTGDIVFDRRTLNKAIFVDVKVDEDTLRVFSVHLYSMSIRAEKLEIDKKYKEVKSGFTDVFRRLRNGFATHSRQIGIVDSCIQQSPYPVIVCGDFNSMPYSYTYQKMRRQLSNAFEDAGNGFGFSYRDPKLFFLRIDNQFYSESRLSAYDFQTHREVEFSDHFPITATYTLKPKSKP